MINTVGLGRAQTWKVIEQEAQTTQEPLQRPQTTAPAPETRTALKTPHSSPGGLYGISQAQDTHPKNAKSEKGVPPMPPEPLVATPHSHVQSPTAAPQTPHDFEAGKAPKRVASSPPGGEGRKASEVKQNTDLVGSATVTEPVTVPVTTDPTSFVKLWRNAPYFQSLKDIEIDRVKQAGQALTRALRATKTTNIFEFHELLVSDPSTDRRSGLSAEELVNIAYYDQVLAQGYLGAKGSKVWVCPGCHIWHCTRSATRPTKCRLRLGCPGIPERVM